MKNVKRFCFFFLAFFSGDINAERFSFKMASRFFIFSNPEIPFAKGQPAVFSFYSQCWHLQMDTKAPFMSFNSRGLKENKAKFLDSQFMLGWHERESETLVFQKSIWPKGLVAGDLRNLPRIIEI